MTRFLRRLLCGPCTCPFCRADAGEPVRVALAVSAAPGRVIVSLCADGRVIEMVYRPGGARSYANAVIEAADLAEAEAVVAAESVRGN